MSPLCNKISRKVLRKMFLWILLLISFTTYSLTYFLHYISKDFIPNHLVENRHTESFEYVFQEVKENWNTTRKLLGAHVNLTEDLDKLLVEDLDSLTPVEIVRDVTELYRSLSKECSKTILMGGMFECENGRRGDEFAGYKTVCFDDRVRPVPKKCTMLSFGLAYDFSFDYAASKFGCKVYSFDFSVTNVKNSYYSRNSHFLNIALSNVNDQNVVLDLAWYRTKETPNGHLTSRLTLSSILDVLDLQGSAIDYLKIDVEYNEWSIFHQIFTNDTHLLDNVQQIIVETHFEKLRYLSQDYEHITEMYDAFRLYRLLFAEGFRLIHWIPNPYTTDDFNFQGIMLPIYEELHFVRTEQKSD